MDGWADHVLTGERPGGVPGSRGPVCAISGVARTGRNSRGLPAGAWVRTTCSLADVRSVMAWSGRVCGSLLSQAGAILRPQPVLPALGLCSRVSGAALRGVRSGVPSALTASGALRGPTEAVHDSATALASAWNIGASCRASRPVTSSRSRSVSLAASIRSSKSRLLSPHRCTILGPQRGRAPASAEGRSKTGSDQTTAVRNRPDARRAHSRTGRLGRLQIHRDRARGAGRHRRMFLSPQVQAQMPIALKLVVTQP